MAQPIEIPLTQSKTALVDAQDAPKVLRHTWCVQKDGRQFYAVTGFRGNDGTMRLMRLHRFILNPPPKTGVDHIDGDGLNNQRRNLRLATHSQNQHNSRVRSDNKSGFKGVHWSKHARKWHVQIMVDGRTKFLGLFENKKEAGVAYDAAARELFGAFARTNARMISLCRLEKKLFLIAKLAIQRGISSPAEFVAIAHKVFTNEMKS
jgi:hypothetical protein